MKILHTLPRHAAQLGRLQVMTKREEMKHLKYICIVVDGPESVNRELSYASDFTPEDTHKILSACAEQTR